MKEKSIIGLLFILISMSSLAQQTTIQKAWDSFKTNKIAESRRYFIEATTEDPNNAEAYLMLSILASIDKTPDEALSYFIKFTDVTTEDINPYLRSLWYSESVANGLKTRIDAKRVNFMLKLLQSGRLNSTTKAYALETLGDHYKLSNDLKKSDEYFRQIGSVTNWQITGTFDNISGSGFHKMYDPIVFAQQSSIFTNKYQAPVKWFEMKETQSGRWLDLTYHFDVENSVIYAQTFCNSQQQQDVVLRIGTSGSLKVWVNDKILFTEPDERNNGTDTYTFTARLNKGFNRILLQIGSSEIERSNFLVRVTDDKGNLLENLSFSSDYQPYNEDKSDFKSEIIPNFADAYFMDKIEKKPDNLLNYMLLTSSYLANDKTYFAQKNIQNAEKLAPDCSYLLSQLIEIYARGENWTQYSTALEKLKDIDPENPTSLKLFYNEAIDKKDYEEAKNILGKIEKIFGKDEYVLRRLIELEAIEKQNENYYRTLNEAYKKYPENVNFVYWKYRAEKERTKNTAKAADILKDFLDVKYNVYINNYYVQALFETVQAKKGFKYLHRLTEYDPDAVGYYSIIATVYFELRNYHKAIEYYEKCIELAPYIGSYQYYLGKCYEELLNLTKAKELYLEALKYNPNDYKTREELRQLENKQSVFGYFDTPDFYQLFKESPNAADYPGESCVILLEETQKVVFEGGGNQEKRYLLVKVLNSDGIDLWKEYEILFEKNQALEVEKAEVIKKNGTKVKAETDYNQIVFTSLEAGDAISLIYKLDTYESGKFMKHFTDVCYFNYFLPARTIKYSLLISPNTRFDRFFSNSEIKPEITQKVDFVLYKWEKHDIPAVKYENYMPALTDVGEVLFISTLPDWNFLSEWYADVTNNQLKSDFYIQEKAKELFEEKSNLTQMEKANVIFNYVTKEIRYSSIPFRQSGLIPQKPSEVIATRMGDCKDVSTLFVALCREVGIEANLVLIYSRENGKNETTLPSFPFDHSIAQVVIDGEEYFIELTSDLFSFASLPPEVYKSQALLIKESKGQKVAPFTLDPPTMVKNSIIRNQTVEFDNDTMILKTDSKKTGWLAADMRSIYRNLSEEERNKKMISIISYDYSNAELLSLTFDESLDNSGNEVSYKYDYVVNNVFTRINKLEIFHIPFTDNFTSSQFDFGKTRDYPLEYWKTYRSGDFSERITIKIPEGKQLAEVPENVDIQSKIAHYQVTFKVEKNMLIADRILKFTDDVVSNEDYPGFKDFITKVINADAMQIAFKSK